ncbi:MAG: UPF0182 family protein [Dehalococcoidia bacterium]
MRENGGAPPFGGWNGTLVLPPNTGTFIKWGLVVLGLVFFLVALNILRTIYTDWLWFNHLGFLNVFTTVLWTRIWMFLTGFAVFGVLITASVVTVRRHSQGESVLPLPAETLRLLNRLLTVVTVLGAILLSIVFGAMAASRWELVLRLANSSSFGITDPVFTKDISFYVFTFPVLDLIQGWFLAVLIVLLVASAAMYFAYHTLRGSPFVVTPWIRGHMAFLGSLVFFDLAVNHFLDRYELLFSSGGAVFGATYTDIHARMLALAFLTVIAVATGVLLLVSILPVLRGTRGTRLIIGAVGLWILSAIVVSNLYPSFVQRFTVEPNELEREKPYIARNIEFTTMAFNLADIEQHSYSAREEVSKEDIAANLETINNVRLWDPRPLQDVYNQRQHLRLYYNFFDVDVDRYTLDGEYRQVLIGARELYPENLPIEAQRWVNQKLQYTHGYGAAASPVTEFSAEGRPEYFVRDIPPQGPISITRPEIYYGENTTDYVIVGSKQPEFDHPTEDTPAYVTYEGKGGVELKSLLRRLAYTLQFADVNILISSQITGESRLQYRREIQERVETVAPFLVLDSDPYLVVDDGLLLWIQDAYTVTDRYPYSQPFNDSFNYIRNSVKVVISPYDGSMDFYISDPDDPIVQTYRDIFPTLFKDIDEMPSSLRSHVRYPEDLFSIQAQTYLQYHMTDPTVFFNKEDQWSIPLEIVRDTQQPVVPYYVIMKLPGEEEVEFVLILPFTPAEKPNMVSWMAARMDMPHYGELINFTFPRGVTIDGPVQIEASIDNDTEISQQFTLWGQAGSEVIRGNLLVIPIGESILYVEPIYLQAEGIALPELKRVILASSKKVVMEPSLDEALAALVGAPVPVQPGPPGTIPTEPSQAADQLERIQQVLQDLRQGLTSLEEAITQLAQLIEEEQQ